ncbi:sensor histidine kinase [Embleya sp. NPDC008237]|uniref:sensor histidine kinase n=1 Tax=Embleya sp. NPDC008237 TaxID=3363978 RepID=UPI0036F17954
MGLRTRLTVIYGVMFLVAGVLLLTVTYTLFTQQLDRRGTKVITRVGPEGSQLLVSAPGKGETILLPEPAHTLPAEGPMTPGADAERWFDDQRRELRRAASHSLITQGGIALFAVGGAATGLGAVIAGRVLAPLRRVTDTARRIAGAPSAVPLLHERIALRGPDDEVKDLADTFDTMVERLDRSFDGQRRFVANASHELRTPLTLGRALVEVAMHRRTASPDLRTLGTRLLEINARHERLIAGLLALAGSDNAITERALVDLADIATHVCAQSEPEARRAGVEMIEGYHEAPTTGDALLLEQLVRNLVENAIRHNTAHAGRLHVRTGTNAGGVALLEVGNTGAELTADVIPTLFEPFRRAGPARLVTAKGAGLGLSIVRSICVAHGGSVDAEPRPGGGLVVRVELPPVPSGLHTRAAASPLHVPAGRRPA